MANESSPTSGQLQTLRGGSGDPGAYEADSDVRFVGAEKPYLDPATFTFWQVARRILPIITGYVKKTGTATVDVIGGEYVDSTGVVRTVADLVGQSLTTSVTNYIYVADSATAFTVSTSAPTGTFWDVATIAMGGSDFDPTTDVTDLRAKSVYSVNSPGATAGSDAPFDIYNNSGVTLAAGDLIYIDGWNTANSCYSVTKADATNRTKLATFVVTTGGSAGAVCKASRSYVVSGLNTASYSIGTILFLSTTAGGVTDTAPSMDGQFDQIVGAVKVSHASTGEIAFSVHGPLATPQFPRTAFAASGNSGSEMVLGVTDTSAPRTITIQTADIVSGRPFIVKDESGGAATNNITIATQGSETIDGAATAIISLNYGKVRLYSDGTNLFTW